MAWLWIWIASGCEIVWALGLKASEQFSKPKATIVTLVAYAASLVCLSRGMKDVPMGTVYAVWTGVGAAGTAVLGMALYGESREPVRVLFLVLIAAGVVGLALTEGKTG